MSEIKAREMVDSVYCGTISTPHIDIEIYFPKKLDKSFTNVYR